MRRFMMVLAVAVLTTAGVTAAGTGAAAAPRCTPSSAKQVGAVDQHNGERVVVLRQDVDWSCPNAVAWELKLGWSHLTDVKFRVRGGQREVLVSSGGGQVGLFAYPSKRRIWTATVPGPANPHSIELLPNGAVVIADSLGRAPGSTTDGRLLYYAPNGAKPQQTALYHAHAVLYNDGRLWAAGGSRLRQYDIRSNGITQHGRSLDGGVFSGAHDLSPMTNDRRHRVWIAADAVFYYDKYSGRPPVKWTVPAGRKCVKAFGTQPDGQIVEARKDGCTGSVYLNDTVYLFRYDGSHQVAKTLKGAGFYKARPVVWSYY